MQPIVIHSPHDELITFTLRTLESPHSQRVYFQTYRAWCDWCVGQGINPLHYTPAHVIDFLSSSPTTKATRQRQLSAMRKLAQMAYIITPDDETRRLYEGLRLIKAPVPDTIQPGQERRKRALSPAEADKLLRAWDGSTDKDKRNRALIAVLLLSGIRRSEAAALCWLDVDFDNGVLHIRHGKGDKARDVPLAGDFALDALHDWQMRQPSGRAYIFCSVGRGGAVTAQDIAISGTDVYRIVKQTEQRTGVEFKPHDCRRTLITEALATGTPVQTVQAIAGHASGETTLRYAEAVDARRARQVLKLRYG